MTKHILKVARKINLPREICNHLHGPAHAVSHRMWVGFFVMLAGVGFAHISAMLPHWAGMLFDLCGYGVHALGATPFIEWALEDIVE